MATISAVVIVKNESANIEPCLQSVGWCDEIVVMDSGSTDDTLDKARRAGARTFVEPRWRGFGVQRQRAQARATGDWIFMIDADERVTEELREEIRDRVREDDRDRVFAIPRLSWCFGGFVRHGGWYPDHVLRVYPRARAGYGDERVHERLHWEGRGLTVVRLRGDLLHFTYRDLRHYLEKSARYAADWASERRERGRRASLPQGCVHGLACFVKMYLLRAGFLDGGQGFLLAVLSAHAAFAKYADLWVRAREDRSRA